MSLKDDNRQFAAKSSLAYPLALSATLLWSTVATAFKIALRGFSPIQLLFYASLTSLILLAAVNIIRFRGNPFKGVGRRDITTSILSGVLNPFLYYLILFKAYDLLPAQEAQPLNYTWPVALTLISIPILKRNPGWRGLGGMIVSFSGVMLISTRGDPLSFRLSNPLGDALALGSGLVWASYWILNMKRGGDTPQNLMMNFLLGFPLVCAAAAISGGFTFLPFPSLAASLYSGAFEMGFTFLLWNYALNLAKDLSRVSNIAYLSPFLSLLFIRFVLRERIMWSSIVGLILIVGGILIQNLPRPSRRSSPNASLDRPPARR
jgi:drug/metabolite transporter (DMT)-like permease